MVQRTFTFPDTAKGRTDFRIAYEAFRARDPQKAKDERKAMAELQRALEAISEPVGDQPEEADVDLRFRKLQAKGGSVTISQKTFEKLEQFVNDTPFQAGFSTAVVDFLDRWGTAEKQDADEEKPAALKRVRA